MNQSVFITGTNTDIGKTFISAMMLSSAIQHELDLNYFKPMQSGDDLDHQTIKALTDARDEQVIEPVYTFKLPATPYLAARAENKKVDHQQILARFKEVSKTACMVEGAGGLLVPVCEKTTVRDVIKTLDIPTIIIASTTLGTMNHTLLTIESALNAGIDVKGVVLSGDPYPDLVEVLNRFTSVPILAEVPIIDKKDFKQKSAEIFHKDLLLEIFS